jgi:hypothetical protein
MLIDLGPLRRNRDYRALYVGQFVSLVGSMITYVAIPTRSPLLAPRSPSGCSAPRSWCSLLVAALLGSATADALAAASCCSAPSCCRPLLRRARPQCRAAEPSVGALFVAAGAMSALNGFHRPALEAMTPRLVSRDEIPAVAALASLRGNLGLIAGPALGSLHRRLRHAAAYVIDAATFAISMAAVATIRAMPAAAGRPARGWAPSPRGCATRQPGRSSSAPTSSTWWR